MQKVIRLTWEMPERQMSFMHSDQLPYVCDVFIRHMWISPWKTANKPFPHLFRKGQVTIQQAFISVMQSNQQFHKPQCFSSDLARIWIPLATRQYHSGWNGLWIPITGPFQILAMKNICHQRWDLIHKIQTQQTKTEFINLVLVLFWSYVNYTKAIINLQLTREDPWKLQS